MKGMEVNVIKETNVNQASFHIPSWRNLLFSWLLVFHVEKLP